MTKILSAYCGSIPIPLSPQVNSHEARRRRPTCATRTDAPAAARPRGTSPPLPIRFWNSWTSRLWSPSTRGSGSWVTSAPASLDGRLQLAKRLGEDLLEVHLLETGRLPPDAGEHQQVVDELLHPLGAVDRELDVLLTALVELALVAALDELAEARHLAQRLLQVVRGDVRELLELGVRPAQVLGLLLDDRARLGGLSPRLLRERRPGRPRAAASGRSGRRGPRSRVARRAGPPPGPGHRPRPRRPARRARSSGVTTQRAQGPPGEHAEHDAAQQGREQDRPQLSLGTGEVPARVVPGRAGSGSAGRAATPGSRRSASCPASTAARSWALGRVRGGVDRRVRDRRPPASGPRSLTTASRRRMSGRPASRARR